MPSLGQTIKNLRKQAFPNKSLRKVADKMDIGFTHLSRIENDKFVPKAETLKKIADGLNLNDADRFRLLHKASDDEYREIGERMAKENEDELLAIHREKDK